MAAALTGPHYRAKRGAELGGGKAPRAATDGGRTDGWDDGCKGVFVWGGDFTGEPARMHSLQQWRGEGEGTIQPTLIPPSFALLPAAPRTEGEGGRESEDDLP